MENRIRGHWCETLEEGRKGGEGVIIFVLLMKWPFPQTMVTRSWPQELLVVSDSNDSE